MIPARPPLCMFCRRFDRDSADPVKCSSFPRGIPNEIFEARLSHIRSIQGEQPFDGSIPVGWENLAATDDRLDGIEPDEVQSKESARGWTPARKVGQ